MTNDQVLEILCDHSHTITAVGPLGTSFFLPSPARPCVASPAPRQHKRTLVPEEEDDSIRRQTLSLRER